MFLFYGFFFSKLEYFNQIHLLDLPHLAFEQALMQWNPIEVVRFASISKKTLRIVKLFPRVFRKYQLEVKLDKVPSIIVKGTYVSYEITESDLGNNLKMENSSEDVLENFKYIFKKVQEIYNCRVTGVTINSDWFPGQNMEIFDFLKESIHNMTITGFTTNSDAKNFLLNPNLRSVFIENSPFFDLVELLFCEIPKIKLHNSTLTISDLHFFLRSWMIGGTNQNLERLEIDIGVISDLPQMLRNITHELPEEGVQVTDYSKEMPACGGITIRRDDGAVAKLFVQSVDHKIVFVMYVLA